MMNPYSTLDGLNQNIQFLNEHNISYIYPYYSKLQVYYNTKIYHMLKKDDLLSTNYTYKSTYDYLFKDEHIARINYEIDRMKDMGLWDIEINLASTLDYFKTFDKYKPHEIWDNNSWVINKACRELTKANYVFFSYLYSGTGLCDLDNNFIKYKETLRDISKRLTKIKISFMNYESRQAANNQLNSRSACQLAEEV